MRAKGHLVNTYQQLLSLTWIWVGAGRGFSAVEQTKKDYYISVCRRPVNVLLVANTRFATQFTYAISRRVSDIPKSFFLVYILYYLRRDFNGDDSMTIKKVTVTNSSALYPYNVVMSTIFKISLIK